MTNNPYIKIKNNAIKTASPEELTLMLYEGALKFANQGKMALLANDTEKAHNLISRVEAIIEEFQITLDMKYEVSKGLAAMYDYIQYRLIQANMKKDVKELEEVIDYIREMRDTWKEAMQIAKHPKVTNETTVSAI